MKWVRLACVAGVLIGVGVLVPAWGGAEDKGAKEKDKTKDHSVEEIMEKVHGEEGLRTKVAQAARADKVADAREPMEQWVKLAGELSKCEPPRGSAESWKKYSAEYAKRVQGVAAAVKSEKAQAVRDALIALASGANGCNGCHTAHKPQ
jgi:hypothetical protein